jgi:hypothetical protein
MFDSESLLYHFDDKKLNLKENEEITVHGHFKEFYYYVHEIFNCKLQQETNLKGELLDSIYWNIAGQLFEIVRLPIVHFLNNSPLIFSGNVKNYSKKIILVALFQHYPEIERLLFLRLGYYVENFLFFIEKYLEKQFEIKKYFTNSTNKCNFFRGEKD